MRLALHAGTLRGFGSGVVGRAIAESLRKLEGVDALLVLLPSEWPDTWPPEPEGQALSPLTLHRLPSGFASKFIGENLTLRRLLKSWRADALLSLTDTSMIACPLPHVLMVQQAFLAYAPDRLGFSLPVSVKRRFQAMSAYMRLGLGGVERVSVQSEHMKREFCARWSFAPEHVRVIPSTIQPGARRLASASIASPAEAPYVAYVSGPGPHKNHQVLAPMMAAMADSHPELRCLLTLEPEAVPGLVERAKALSVYERFDFVGSLYAEEAMTRLSRASAALLPSRIESFGIPYYESMALGVPAIASDVPCAREALGEGALYAPADDGEAWARALTQVLDERQERSQAARERFVAIERSWDQIAADYLELVYEAMGRR